MTLSIQVSGHHIDVGDSLTQYVEETLKKEILKYFDHAVSAHVTITKENYLFIVHINVNEGTGTGIIVKGDGQDKDAKTSYEIALHRVVTQLKRYKTRIKNHHKKGLSELSLELAEASQAKKYIFRESNEDHHEENHEDENPIIIAEQQHFIPKCTVKEAVMKMDLENLPAKLFINKKDNSIAMVFRRNDGNIAWVDSHMQPTKNK